MQKRKNKFVLAVLVGILGINLWSFGLHKESVVSPAFLSVHAQAALSSQTEDGMNEQEMPSVYPCGYPIGIYLQTDGILVIGTAKVTDENGNLAEPAAGCLTSGDYIMAINGEPVQTKEGFQEALNRFGANPVTLTRKRDGELTDCSLSPVRAEDGSFCLGVWVKDDAQGIGTMTYLTKDGRFAALGHPISDTDTGKMVLAKTGGLYEAQVRMIIRGSEGSPGSYSGIICYDASTRLGTIEKNQTNGIFGYIRPEAAAKLNQSEICQTARREEVTCSQALLRCALGNEAKDYRIMILNTDAGAKHENEFLFQVIDQELLDETGGIVQGMSGSPIIQDGKLVGAVTHVLVNDPTRGYGIFIENMLER
ncbi:MAG: SpoIVB peptidase [Lachnospiraceae bacterium]|nr:SpoIVB peptidase [Lachnospiraceae bacterium]